MLGRNEKVVYLNLNGVPEAGNDYHSVLIVDSWCFWMTEEEWFDWKSYLLDGEEEEIIGVPSQQYLVQI